VASGRSPFDGSTASWLCCGAGVQPVSELVVLRWTRYGHDRLYVQASDGERLGHRDSKTGVVVATWSHREAVRAAAVAYLTGGQRSSTAAEPAEPVPVPVVPWTGGTDLALNRPGRAARDQAVAHRRAAPVRTVVARVLGIHTDERAWRIGADGEEAVAAPLGAGWRVLHAVPVGERGSDIDHVVIGRAGVFIVNAKHRPRARVWVGGETFMVNGHRQPYVRNSRHEATRASRLLTAAGGFPLSVVGVGRPRPAHPGFVGGRSGSSLPRPAEDARFELARGCPQHAFQACAIGQLGESSGEQPSRDPWGCR